MLFEYTTDRLILKVLSEDYASLVLDFYNRDRELFEFYETTRPPKFYTPIYQQTILRFEQKQVLNLKLARFYVFLKEHPSQIIGTVCFHDIERNYYKSCEIGYKFSSEFHHKGYAGEAIRKCIEIAFTDLHLHRITAMVCRGNLPSMVLLERLGFTREGIARDYLQLHGVLCDHIQYSLLSTDTRNSL